MCENFLILMHKAEIERILEDPEEGKCFSVNINFLDLFDSDTDLGNALLTNPEESLRDWNKSVIDVQVHIQKTLNHGCIKSKTNCRIYNLPPWPHVCRTLFPGNEDANKFLQVSGTVIRISACKLLEYQRQYICIKCKYPVTVEAIYDKKNTIKKPPKCPNPEGCSSKNLVSFGELDPNNCKDYQDIKIQEDLSQIGVGTVPNHMLVTLEDDLVNVCKPGENVTITGIVTRRWPEFDPGVKIVVDVVLRANHVQVNNSSGLAITVSDELVQFFEDFWRRYVNAPLYARNIILNSIAPDLYGLHLVKLAVAIVLAGGSQLERNEALSGVDSRAESHLLLVGDPGTGKSQLLRFASKIIPRSVLTTGIGSTAAGLTVSAVIDSGEWQLEAGALVMADGGICCIDEFNSMKEHDRTSIHEAMEQQTISVAKAGMVCKLKTRCSILAACNPKSNLDPSKSLCVNVAMSSPLLSRFDLILFLRDVVDEDKDRALADYLFNTSQITHQDSWNLKKLQAYYTIIRKRSPKLTFEAETILSTYYQLQRKFGSRSKSRTTVRLLESLIRLSQGHAKLMFHDEVQALDAIFAVALADNAMEYEASILNLKLDNNAFEENPDQLYSQLHEIVLEKLNLAQNHPVLEEKITTSTQNSSELSQTVKRPRLLFFTKKRGNSQLSQEEVSLSQDLPIQASTQVNRVVEISKNTQNDSKDSGNFSHFSSFNKSHDNSFKNAHQSLFMGKINQPLKSRSSQTSVKTGPCLKNQSSNSNTSLSEIVRSRNVWDFDLDVEFISQTSDVDKNRGKNENNSKEKCLESPLKQQFKDKTLLKAEDTAQDINLLNCIPSVNDDFHKIDMEIDWDLEGPDLTEMPLTQSDQAGTKLINFSQYKKDSYSKSETEKESKRFIFKPSKTTTNKQPKTYSQDHLNKRNLTEDVGSNIYQNDNIFSDCSQKKQTPFQSSLQTEQIAHKFKFVPKSKATKIDKTEAQIFNTSKPQEKILDFRSDIPSQGDEVVSEKSPHIGSSKSINREMESSPRMSTSNNTFKNVFAKFAFEPKNTDSNTDKDDEQSCKIVTVKSPEKVTAKIKEPLFNTDIDWNVDDMP